MQTPLDRDTSSAEDTRARLIRAAAQLFSEKGYEGASVKELAQRAGVNVSLVSYHFDGKEGLFKAALEQFGKEGLGAAERILTPPNSAEELQIRLKMFIEECYRIQLSQPQLCRILHREVDLASPIALDVFKNTFHRVCESLADFVESARRKGFLREDLDAQIATIQLFGALVHPIKMAPIAQVTLGVSIHDAPFREKVIEHLVTLFLRGFGK